MKNIVICSDGTGNEYGENNTNVVETYTICRKTPAQIVFLRPRCWDRWLGVHRRQDAG